MLTKVSDATGEVAISNGPNKLELMLSVIDGVDNAGPKEMPRRSVTFQVSEKYSSGSYGAAGPESGFVQSIEREGGSGEIFNIQVFFEGLVGEKKEIIRYKGWYNCKTRRGKLVLQME